MSALRRPRVLRSPPQGWSSLALLLGMLLVLGLSVADTRRLTLAGSESVIDSLPALMMAAALIGFLLARSSIGIVRAHVLGAAAAALLLVLVAGAALLGQTTPMPAGLEGLSDQVEAVWLRLDEDVATFLADEVSTTSVTVFLVLGAICWTTAQFGAFSIFRYERGGPAVVAVGTVLFLNVGLGSLVPEEERLPVLPVLAAFTSLAMLLLMRMELVQQRYAWARRHISDTRDVNRLFLRSGVMFVAIAVLSASSLTAWATVEPQEVTVDGLTEPIEDLGAELGRWLGLIGVPPADDEVAARDGSWAVQSEWDEDQARGTTFTASIEEGQLRRNYWWGWADDRFDGRRWESTDVHTEKLPAGQPLPVVDDVVAGVTYVTETTVTIGERRDARRHLFRPSEAAVIAEDVTISRVAEGRAVSDITYVDALEEGDQVVVTSYVRDYSDDGTSPTGNELRAVGEAGPEWVERQPWLEPYLQGAGDAGINGRSVIVRAGQISSATANAYDAARLLQNQLTHMEYETSMGDTCDAYDSVPACVLAERKGFCQHFATTMAMVLREMEIPSRVVTGYLPGELVDGVWTVPQRGFHNWVEAYFPSAGWIRFDPTPGERGLGQTSTDFADGDPLPSGPDSSALPALPSPTPEPFAPEITPEPLAPLDGGDSSGNVGDSIVVGLSMAAIIGLIATVLSVLLLFRLRRLPEGDDSLAYQGIVSLATRLGYGPHPSQTEYEYAETLSEAIPAVREDLHVVADARVETAYGGRHLDAGRQSLLRSAYARIRTALLRLSLRLRR